MTTAACSAAHSSRVDASGIPLSSSRCHISGGGPCLSPWGPSPPAWRTPPLRAGPQLIIDLIAAPHEIIDLELPLWVKLGGLIAANVLGVQVSLEVHMKAV